jgi:hypothetical protein
MLSSLRSAQDKTLTRPSNVRMYSLAKRGRFKVSGRFRPGPPGGSSVTEEALGLEAGALIGMAGQSLFWFVIDFKIGSAPQAGRPIWPTGAAGTPEIDENKTDFEIYNNPKKRLVRHSTY